jgi:hypothetical protein
MGLVAYDGDSIGGGIYIPRNAVGIDARKADGVRFINYALNYCPC